MLKCFGRMPQITILFFIAVSIVHVCVGGVPLDKSKYITIDEIKPGMKAWCLTIFKGTEIEKFDMDVVDVIRNARPGGGEGPGSRDVILVKGTDERFIHTGPIAGCSGSPVYIEGRLAGALAFGWSFSKDPLYGVTPIADMLDCGLSGSDACISPRAFAFDFSKPINFADIDRQIEDCLASKSAAVGGMTALPCPLVTSGIPAEVCENLNDVFKPMGFMAVTGVSGESESKDAKDVKLAPGACLAVPLVSGDVKMTLMGTVTDVVGDKVYGFGHGFLGYGKVNLPMATGRIHTVVSNLITSFKLGSPLETVGVLNVDGATGVVGQIGAEPEMIPLTIKVSRYNVPAEHVYNCKIVVNKMLTPMVLGGAVSSAVFMSGSLPPENTVEYKAAFNVEGFEPVVFENVSTSVGIAEMTTESVGSTALLLNNPYKKVDIKSIDIDVHVAAKNITSHIWSADLSQSKIKPGQTVKVSVILESYLADKKRYEYDLKIPDTLAEGRYDLIITGRDGYLEFLRQSVPHRFIPQDTESLICAINDILRANRGELYGLLVLPPGGIILEKAELPDLPPTRSLILQDAKRAITAQPYNHWLENTVKTGVIVADRKTMSITVER